MLIHALASALRHGQKVLVTPDAQPAWRPRSRACLVGLPTKSSSFG
jgi:hypothetical protein